jgi:hypothetical protein
MIIDSIFEGILSSLKSVFMAEASREDDLLVGGMPDNLTVQQRKRDGYTTKLYNLFVKSYESNRNFASIFKVIICAWCLIIVSGVFVACVMLAFYILQQTERTVGDIIALISATIPLATAVMGILQIVTKHVFPEDDEKHVTEIVKAIHDNDFKNKQENIRQQNGSATNDIILDEV